MSINLGLWHLYLVNNFVFLISFSTSLFNSRHSFAQRRFLTVSMELHTTASAAQSCLKLTKKLAIFFVGANTPIPTRTFWHFLGEAMASWANIIQVVSICCQLFPPYFFPHSFSSSASYYSSRSSATRPSAISINPDLCIYVYVPWAITCKNFDLQFSRHDCCILPASFTSLCESDDRQASSSPARRQEASWL